MLDILNHVIAAEPDMRVVGVVDGDELPAAIRRTRADVVVVGQTAQDERDFHLQLLLRHPHVKLLAIAESGKSGSLYELRPRRISLGKLSAGTLANAIRRQDRPSSKIRTPKRRPAEIH